LVFSNAAIMLSTTAGPARMLPCAVAYFPLLLPAHSVAFGPVYAAYSPFRFMTANWRPGLAPPLGQRIGIVFQNFLDDVLRQHLFPQQLERLRPVADVDNRLRRRRADVGVGPEDAVAGRKHTRLDGTAYLAGRRIETKDRKRS